MDDTACSEIFDDLMNVTESRGGSIGDDFAHGKLCPNHVTLSADEQKAARKDMQQRHLVHCFLKGSDGCGFGKLKEDLDNNNCTQDNNKCPKTVTETHQCKMKFKCLSLIHI